MPAQALAAAPPDPPAPLGLRATHRFRIPGPVVEKISERTGLTGDAPAAALLDEGTAAQSCDVNIALIEAALGLPEERGAPLLRDMSAGL